MGCGNGSKPRAAKLVQISPARVRKPRDEVVRTELGEPKPQRKQRTDKPQRMVPMVEDFHCPHCGLTLHDRPVNYHHRCPGDKPIEYQIERQRKCDDCLFNVDGVCEKLKREHPDRDCVIAVGIKMAHAYCPIGEWDRVGMDCKSCGRFTMFDGAAKCCRYCGECE